MTPEEEIPVGLLKITYTVADEDRWLTHTVVDYSRTVPAKDSVRRQFESMITHAQGWRPATNFSTYSFQRKLEVETIGRLAGYEDGRLTADDQEPAAV